MPWPTFKFFGMSFALGRARSHSFDGPRELAGTYGVGRRLLAAACSMEGREGAGTTTRAKVALPVKGRGVCQRSATRFHCLIPRSNPGSPAPPGSSGAGVAQPSSA